MDHLLRMQVTDDQSASFLDAASKAPYSVRNKHRLQMPLWRGFRDEEQVVNGAMTVRL